MARNETHVTILTGPVRSHEAHIDPPRVTYYSQGREWLIDPLLEEAAGMDSHSIVLISGQRYKRRAVSEVIRRYTVADCEGLVTANRMYPSTQWNRHVVFARTANYLVVNDTLRSRINFVAFQQWIVAPDLVIESIDHGILLRSDAHTVAIISPFSSSRDFIVEAMETSEGVRYAWRVRIHAEGNHAQFTSVIMDVMDLMQFRIRRGQRIGNEHSISIQDKHVDETLVIGSDYSAILPPDIPPRAAIARAKSIGTTGGLNDTEFNEQRTAVRRAISTMKSEIRRSGETDESRIDALNRLLQIGSDLRIEGVCDHGYAAALIDIAGPDLFNHIRVAPQIGRVSRSPLLQWNNRLVVQQDYGVRLFTTLDARRLPDKLNENLIWSVDLGQLVLSAFVLDAPGDTLTVYFHGATNRTRNSIPRYERLRSFSDLGLGPIMFFSDASLDIDSSMILSWYLGTEEVDLPHEMAQMIDSYARKRGIDQILLVGNSGGGFTALQQAAHLEGSLAIALNPQIRLDDYAPRISKRAQRSLFGSETVSDIPRLASRTDVIMQYRRLNFEANVILFQNTGDADHYENHFVPFRDEFLESANARHLTTLTPYLGPGHLVPTPEEYLQIVRDASSIYSGTWEYAGLRVWT